MGGGWAHTAESSPWGQAVTWCSPQMDVCVPYSGEPGTKSRVRWRVLGLKALDAFCITRTFLLFFVLNIKILDFLNLLGNLEAFRTAITKFWWKKVSMNPNVSCVL